MPKLVRLYITQTLIAFAISAGFVAVLLGMNVANLWDLIRASDIGLLAVFMLWMFHGIVFSGVQFGITIMRMAAPEGGDGGGKRDDLPLSLPRSAAPQPIRVKTQ